MDLRGYQPALTERVVAVKSDVAWCSEGMGEPVEEFRDRVMAHEVKVKQERLQRAEARRLNLRRLLGIVVCCKTQGEAKYGFPHASHAGSTAPFCEQNRLSFGSDGIFMGSWRPWACG